MSKKVLIVTYGGGHVKIALPVIRELIKRGHCVEVLGLTTSALIFEKENIKYKGMKDYIHLFSEKSEILNIGNQVIDGNFNSSLGLDREEIVSYLGLNIFDLFLQKGNYEDAYEIFNSNGRHAFFPYNTMKRIIEYEKPDVVFLTCGRRSEMAAGIVAQDNNIGVLRVIDLLGEDDLLPYKAKVCVMNEIVKKNIIENNSHLNRDDIYITGQPNLEVNVNYEEINKIKKNFHTDKYLHSISFFSQPGFSEVELVIPHLKVMMEKHPEYICFYKLHPSEDEKFYKKFKDNMPNNLIILKDVDLDSLINLTDVAITYTSTVGLQAALCGKPLITVNLRNKNYATDYAKYDCAIEVSRLVDISDTIESLLDENSKFVKILTDGRRDLEMPKFAARNIVDVIERMSVID